MKKLCAAVLIALLLVPLLTTPADAQRRGGHGGHFRGGNFHHFRGHGGGAFFFGLGVGALLTAPWWCCPAYGYPAYSYPAYYPYPAYYSYPTYYPYTATDVQTYPTPTYPAPTYSTPTPPPTAPPQSQPPPSSPPQSQSPGGNVPAPGPSQGYSQNCQGVWVEGHYETRVLANGQRVTAWVPAYQLCQ